MRKAPRNPNTDPDDPSPWRGAIETSAPPPENLAEGEESSWCLRSAVGFNLLGIRDLYGARKQIRCPRCNRRLLPCETRCVGGEFTGWALPPHKKPAKKKAKPKRKERHARLGRR